MKIKISIFFFLFAHTLYAQIGNFYITPVLGIQSYNSKVTFNNYTKGILENRLRARLLYGIRVEKQLKTGNIIFLQYQNGLAGYSISVDSKPCNNYNGPISIAGQSSAFNNKRFNIGYALGLKKKNNIEANEIQIKTRFNFGITLDFKSNETNEVGGGFTGPNRCGENYYIEESSYSQKSISIALPIGLNFELLKGQNRRIGFSLLYTQGLTTNTTFQLDYVTATYRDKAILRSKGSGLSVALFYPILIKRKLKKLKGN